MTDATSGAKKEKIVLPAGGLWSALSSKPHHPQPSLQTIARTQDQTHGQTHNHTHTHTHNHNQANAPASSRPIALADSHAPPIIEPQGGSAELPPTTTTTTTKPTQNAKRLTSLLPLLTSSSSASTTRQPSHQESASQHTSVTSGVNSKNEAETPGSAKPTSGALSGAGPASGASSSNSNSTNKSVPAKKAGAVLHLLYKSDGANLRQPDASKKLAEPTPRIPKDKPLPQPKTKAAKVKQHPPTRPVPENPLLPPPPDPPTRKIPLTPAVATLPPPPPPPLSVEEMIEISLHQPKASLPPPSTPAPLSSSERSTSNPSLTPPPKVPPVVIQSPCTPLVPSHLVTPPNRPSFFHPNLNTPASLIESPFFITASLLDFQLLSNESTAQALTPSRPRRRSLTTPHSGSSRRNTIMNRRCSLRSDMILPLMFDGDNPENVPQVNIPPPQSDKKGIESPALLQSVPTPHTINQNPPSLQDPLPLPETASHLPTETNTVNVKATLSAITPPHRNLLEKKTCKSPASLNLTSSEAPSPPHPKRTKCSIEAPHNICTIDPPQVEENRQETVNTTSHTKTTSTKSIRVISQEENQLSKAPPSKLAKIQNTLPHTVVSETPPKVKPPLEASHDTEKVSTIPAQTPPVQPPPLPPQEPTTVILPPSTILSTETPHAHHQTKPQASQPVIHPRDKMRKGPFDQIDDSPISPPLTPEQFHERIYSFGNRLKLQISATCSSLPDTTYLQESLRSISEKWCQMIYMQCVTDTIPDDAPLSSLLEASLNEKENETRVQEQQKLLAELKQWQEIVSILDLSHKVDPSLFKYLQGVPETASSSSPTIPVTSPKLLPTLKPPEPLPSSPDTTPSPIPEGIKNFLEGPSPLEKCSAYIDQQLTRVHHYAEELSEVRKGLDAMAQHAPHNSGTGLSANIKPMSIPSLSLLESLSATALDLEQLQLSDVAPNKSNSKTHL
ncbi:hypothetical protein Pelo_8866 [Pelomyxa schiedti]|nr:hypothetical protein Pelo_8866 [Pelomyxa schiedti]